MEHSPPNVNISRLPLLWTGLYKTADQRYYRTYISILHLGRLRPEIGTNLSKLNLLEAVANVVSSTGSPSHFIMFLGFYQDRQSLTGMGQETAVQGLCIVMADIANQLSRLGTIVKARSLVP